MEYESQEHYEDDQAHQQMEDEGRAMDEADGQGEAEAQAGQAEEEN